MSADGGDVSDDGVLGGRLALRQPRLGHRVGHDAILLAAATHEEAGGHAIDLGAGVGAAGLALAHRVDGLGVTLVEIDADLTALAHGNAQRNGLGQRVRAVCLDVAAPAAAFAAAGLTAGSATAVLMNPPFNVSPNPSPDDRRRMAHTASDDTLRQWLAAAARLLRPHGSVTLIWRADGLGDVISALGSGFGSGFGAVAILPVHPKPGAPAIRVLVRGVKASRAALALWPGLILADAKGRPTPEAEAVLRNGDVLPFALK
jgi:tRNA1(Val) A37 N6-methylase TrmN6